ncbi:MAG TPA: hypothetical protein VFD30_13480 [Terriglobia bacterium]|jgi:hypothetical protein|nr:hypothetical protein [Terriglobia bacterium]
MGQTIEVPAELFSKFLRASEALDEWHDAFEDFLILHNPGLLRRLRKARREQLAGKTRPWDEFKKGLNRSARRSR